MSKSGAVNACARFHSVLLECACMCVCVCCSGGGGGRCSSRWRSNEARMHLTMSWSLLITTAAAVSHVAQVQATSLSAPLPLRWRGREGLPAPPIRFAASFGDHMVLQSGKNVSVWGYVPIRHMRDCCRLLSGASESEHTALVVLLLSCTHSCTPCTSAWKILNPISNACDTLDRSTFESLAGMRRAGR